MWKTILIVSSIVLLLGTGSFLLLRDQRIIRHITPTNPFQRNGSPITPTPTRTETVTPTETSHVIKDALISGASLSCEYTDSECRKAKTYIKDGNVRIDYTAQQPEDSGTTIITNRTMYVWSTVTKTGYQMDLSSTTATAAANIHAYNVVAGLEKYKQFCNPADVSDDIFDLPVNLKLEDYSKKEAQ